ncbi:META domain-containing protein [uncultured Pontibacter sp.]|uniref:META domain-containing protein n=1 Tax=uncultured Pontibacter sp. TaxID=453356 RepID=UPI0026331C71|nr:META domain-containing protein [uncultured Pontibacter sp.]
MFKIRFLIFANFLILILISSCATNKVDTNAGSTSHNDVVEQEQVGSNLEDLQEKYEQGVDFVASGNEPFWTLEIHGDMLIDFKTTSPEDASIKVPMSVVVELKDGENISYQAETSDGVFTVKLMLEDCQEPLSGKKSPYSVQVNYKNTVYKGCGSYLINSRLEGNWILEQLNGKEVTAEKGPFLNLSLKDNRVSGNAGCNRISGSLEAKRHTLYVGAIAATRMACPDLEIENEVLELLNKSAFEYRIVDGKLLLFQGGSEVMVLRR